MGAGDPGPGGLRLRSRVPAAHAQLGAGRHRERGPQRTPGSARHGKPVRKGHPVSRRGSTPPQPPHSVPEFRFTTTLPITPGLG
jgi:hypothetical protein